MYLLFIQLQVSMEEERFTSSTFESVFIIRAVQLYDDIVNLEWFS